MIGAVGYVIAILLLERRHEKAQQLTIVDALIIETAENLTICEDPTARKMWPMTPYKLEAYHAYKGQILFLPVDVRMKLAAAVFHMEGGNIAVQMQQLYVVFGPTISEKSMPPPEQLIDALKSANNELQKWREKHTHSRLFNLVSTIWRRL